jgi:hypothetical protein
MKKKLIALILIIMALLFVTSCEKKEEKATTVYFDFFGSRFDLQDRTLIPEIGIIDLGYENSGTSFSEYLEELKEDEETYVVCRLKCVGDLKQKVDMTKSPPEGRNQYETLYTEIPFEVTEIYEGECNLLTVGETVKVNVDDMFLYTKLYRSAWWEEYQKIYEVMGEEKATEGIHLKFYCRKGIESILPRVNYEYVLVLIYDKETDMFSALLNHHACELSTPVDYITFKDNFSSTEEWRKKKSIEDRMPRAYYEILERYNIKVK